MADQHEQTRKDKELKREALKRNSMEQRRVDVSWNSVETEWHRGDRR